jgi:hypothetical protein
MVSTTARTAGCSATQNAGQRADEQGEHHGKANPRKARSTLLAIFIASS